MVASPSFGSTEILQVADAVARDKNIKKEYVLDAMESSIAIAARKKYGYDKSITATINHDSGEISIFRDIEVVADDFEDEEEELGKSKILLKDAKEKDENLEIGDHIREDLPPIDLGRVAAQTAKQVIVQKVREAERERQYEEFQSRVGEIVNGIVKRVEFGNVIVDLGGNTEAIIRRNSTIRGEMFRVNDRLRAYIEKVERENKGPQIFLSRTSPEFMVKLFTQEVPEIYDGMIQVKAAAREPGSRAKIAVYSEDFGLDPVGSCVGVRGARVQAVSNELQGEKIDIVQWSGDLATFLVNALAPAEVAKVVIDEENNRIEAVVPDDQLSLAIGRRGQNIRMASELVGFKIDVMTEDEESLRRVEEFNKISKLFIDALNIEEIIAHLLVTEDFTSVEEIAYAEIEELAAIEGFDPAIAEELQGRAKEYLEQKQKNTESAITKLGIKDDLRDFDGLSDDIIITLGENNIKTLDDFADLSHDEFIEIVPDSGLSDEKINDIIMLARSHWFEDEVSDSDESESLEDKSEDKKAV